MKIKRFISLTIAAVLAFGLIGITSTAADADCVHTYNGPCDADCNKCGATRIAAEHYFADSDDYTCDGCGLSLKTHIPGDVNSDGTVNGKDFAILRQYLNDWDVTINETAADVNADSIVNGKDMALLRQYLNDWDVTLKSPEGSNSGEVIPDDESGWLEGWY